MTARHAIYLPPPAASPLEAFACAWLGRDHVSGAEVPLRPIEGVTPERHEALTAAPRNYGFHATLKAPFALAPDVTVADLQEAARAFAAARTPFAVKLSVRLLGAFVACVPTEPSPNLDRLAAECVRAFEPLRRPLDEADIARRRQSTLTERQDVHLLRWGYPYVFEDFRFHMSLTGRLSPAERPHLLTRLQEATADLLARPMPVGEIAIYTQPDRTTPFVLTHRYTFARG
ncbi:MAG: DUF1045 domain-containing protein [Geminicoccaceae bacterium]|nr:DUF1045 domain-containing protein [Geminicoccaceae bacterium]